MNAGLRLRAAEAGAFGRGLLRSWAHGLGPALTRAPRLGWLVVRGSLAVVEAAWVLSTLPAAAVRMFITDLLLRWNAIPLTEARYFRLTGGGPYLRYEAPPSYAAGCAVALGPMGVMSLLGLLGVLPLMLLRGVLDAAPTAERVATTLLAATLAAGALPDRFEAGHFLRATARAAGGGNPFAVVLLPLALLAGALGWLPAFLRGPLAGAGAFYAAWVIATRLAV